MEKGNKWKTKGKNENKHLDRLLHNKLGHPLGVYIAKTEAEKSTEFLLERKKNG